MVGAGVSTGGRLLSGAMAPSVAGVRGDTIMDVMPRWYRLALPLLPWLVALAPAQKYSGPRPAKPDVPYLLHAASLLETEAGEAREEKRKDDTAYVVAGAGSPARTPLAEPIFLLVAEKLAPEKLELYAMTVKGGQREVLFPANPGKRRKDTARPFHLSVTKLEGNLYRIEVNEGLENGEYSLTPGGTNQVFCFQVY